MHGRGGAANMTYTVTFNVCKRSDKGDTAYLVELLAIERGSARIVVEVLGSANAAGPVFGDWISKRDRTEDS